MATPVAQPYGMTVTRRQMVESEKGGKEVQYRISRPTGWFMTTVAVIFDLLPLLLIVGAVAVTFVMLGGSACLTEGISSDVMAGAKWAQERGWGATGQAVAGLSNIKVIRWDGLGSTFSGVRCIASGGLAVGSGIFLGPAIYFLGSIVATVLSFIVFYLWFSARRVFIFSFRSRRVIANSLALITKSLPLINLLPGTTVAVMMHIRQTRAEDRERHKKKYGNNALM